MMLMRRKRTTTKWRRRCLVIDDGNAELYDDGDSNRVY